MVPSEYYGGKGNTLFFYSKVATLDRSGSGIAPPFGEVLDSSFEIGKWQSKAHSELRMYLSQLAQAIGTEMWGD
jgi:hypothetical protein